MPSRSLPPAISGSFALLLLLLTLSPSPALAAAHLALDLGAPIDGSGAISARITEGTAADAGADQVRVNFILGPWSSPEDGTGRGPEGLTWFQTYDRIIDTLKGQGLEVYALIGAEAVRSGAPSINSDLWVADYTYNFVSIVNHFKDRVRVYESFNEPNDWAGGSSAQLQPYYFALALQEVYLNTKVYAGHADDPAWQVTLVSGPLFTHDQDNGASYLASVYNEGRSRLAWDWCRANVGTYPLDGVGYHLYVAQGSTNATTVTNGLNANLNALWSTLTAQEGASTPKRLWVSELGWSSDAVGESGQAANLTTGMNLLLKDSRIALATWFTTQDWPGSAWGLYRTSGLSPADRKEAWTAFNDIATGGSSGGCSQAGERGGPAGSSRSSGLLPLLLVGVALVKRRVGGRRS